ncbi:uncharacterized protein LOC131938014 [Physella acuta]|uniref:uncharacterized protein LOC131938014 n=1 Tax=Physella acuta TaxID=109671 RepID=UPI0027DD7EED|nr:uncharacterized protein LOC131938014 [Physella acuta]
MYPPGWRVEMMVACAGHVTINLLCAMTAQLWAFYLTAIWTGFFRMAVVTLPFVLANQFALDQGGEKNTGVALACVASMLPGGFLVCSALLGPLIDVTGNPATPIYYTAATALLGGVTIFFLK